MDKNPHKLLLHTPATYQVKVPGALDALWIDEVSSISIGLEETDDRQTISTLTGLMDQATLQSLIRRLYGLGIPLISVIRIGENEQKH